MYGFETEDGELLRWDTLEVKGQRGEFPLLAPTVERLTDWLRRIGYGHLKWVLKIVEVTPETPMWVIGEDFEISAYRPSEDDTPTDASDCICKGPRSNPANCPKCCREDEE